MISLPYIEPVFRPPSEWRSLILQVTNGCSWNKCTFCEMYTQPQKQFRPKSLTDINSELKSVAQVSRNIRRMFLADGDAMVLSYRRLKEILMSIQQHFPNIQRVSSYCLPSNIAKKSVDELMSLRELGLSLVYVGCESGDDEVLTSINKGETYRSSLEALQKLKAAKIKSSVMILNGMGGVELSEQHAIQSASLMNEAQPEYLSTLVVSFPLGDERVKKGFDGRFVLPNKTLLLEEMKVLIEHLDLKSTIFRSDHASNYLALKGVLGKDKEHFLNMIHLAISSPDILPLREEWQRGL